MKNAAVNCIRLWAEGVVLFVLRWLQLRSGFDSATGLSKQSVPGLLLAGAIILIAAVEIVFALKLPRGKFSYGNTFAPLEQKLLPLLVAGSFLMGVGGILIPGWETLKIAAAAAGVAAAAGFLLFAKLLRGSAEVKSYALLPSMIFAVLFVLVIYLPQDSNPVLARYYLQVLTSSMIACAFYQLAGFPCQEASARWFSIFGGVAVPLCVASAADCIGVWGPFLIYWGAAMVLTTFLALRRQSPVPEPKESGTEEVQE